MSQNPLWFRSDRRPTGYSDWSARHRWGTTVVGLASRAGTLVLGLWALNEFSTELELSALGIVIGVAAFIGIAVAGVLVVPWQAERRARHPRLLFSRAAELIVVIPLVVGAGLVLAPRYGLLSDTFASNVALSATLYALISVAVLEGQRRRADSIEERDA